MDAAEGGARDEPLHLGPGQQQRTKRWASWTRWWNAGAALDSPTAKRGAARTVAPKGRAEGQRATLRRQLQLKFGPLPTAVVAALEAMDLAALDAACDRVLAATRLEDVVPATCRSPGAAGTRFSATRSSGARASGPPLAPGRV